MVAAVRRVHRRANVEMVSCVQLAAVLKGITAAHIKEHGSESLLPGRMEPLGPALLRSLLSTPTGTKLGSKVLDWDSPLFLCLGAMMALAGGTGFRKAEVAKPNGIDFDDRRLRRASLLWLIDGVLVADPTPLQLEDLVELRDAAVIKPPRSKGDQDGSKFGAHPVYQPYNPSDPANAAARLRRIELRYPRHGAQRLSTPLFFSDARTFAPITHSMVDTYLHHLIRHNVPAADVNNYSFHSFRIGFACALLAAGCPYDMIQALARWRSAESVKIYARLNPSDYANWVSKALTQVTTSHTTARLPVIDAHGVIATFGLAGQLFRQATTTEE
jgi:integrase